VTRLTVIAWVALLAPLAAAQSKTEVALQLLADGADAYATERNVAFRYQFHEADPVSRPFVTHGTPLLAAYFAADAGLKIGAEYWLTRHHHQKLAHVVGWLGIADSAWGASTSFAKYRQRYRP